MIKGIAYGREGRRKSEREGRRRGRDKEWERGMKYKQREGNRGIERVKVDGSKRGWEETFTKLLQGIYMANMSLLVWLRRHWYSTYSLLHGKDRETRQCNILSHLMFVSISITFTFISMVSVYFCLIIF